MSANANEIRATLLSRRHWTAVAAAEEQMPSMLDELDALSMGELEALAHLCRRVEALHRNLALACERRYLGDA